MKFMEERARSRSLGSNDLSMTSNEDPIDILVDSIYFDVYELDD